jgi:uncharacterized damage-inducible protein DinB
MYTGGPPHIGMLQSVYKSSPEVQMTSSISSNRLNLATRRSFLGASAATLAAGFTLSEGAEAATPDATGLNVLGPRPGYSPMIGVFVSEFTWMREANGVLRATKGLSQADLDVLFDANANTIGALMLHLAATETYYGMHTFQGMKWGSWPDEVKKKWDPAMELGDAGRKTIKGHDRDYYVGILQEVREKTLAEFRKKDDAWLMTVDKDPDWNSMNNLCKWFHVCEHEAHHTGQIAWLRKRLPGAKSTTEG